MASTTSAAKASSRTVQTPAIGPGGPWHPKAPRRLRETYRSSGDQQGWAAWRKHLNKRKRRPIARGMANKRSPLAWAVNEDERYSAALRLIKKLSRLQRAVDRKLATWLDEASADWLAATSSAALREGSRGLECLAWCHSLPQLTEVLPSERWWSLANRLIDFASSRNTHDNDPLGSQWLNAELALSLALVLPELAACRALIEPGRQSWVRAMAELLDGEGLLHGRYLALLRPLLACWTRCQILDRALGGEAGESQYSGLVQHALRLSRNNGQPVLSGLEEPSWDPELLKAALRESGDRQTRRLYRLTIGRKSHGDTGGVGRPLAPAFEGEWAGMAVLRPNWNRSSACLTVSHGGPQVLLELSVGKQCLASGPWRLDVRLDGQPLAEHGDWHQICWETDDEVDYLELEMSLSPQITVQRHIVMARKDRFLLLADAVLGIGEGLIEYRGALPIQGFSTFQGETETREGTLSTARGPQARVLPLALGEWRCGPGQGSLQADRGPLELAQSAQGQCLFAPLFIDLSGSRLDKPVTWRQLTVGQHRTIVPSDLAVGYRVQAGQRQWLAYRSLAPVDVRTVLGQNLLCEFLVSRFKRDGKIATIIEIE
jgi:hypothetical protein